MLTITYELLASTIIDAKLKKEFAAKLDNEKGRQLIADSQADMHAAFSSGDFGINNYPIQDDAFVLGSIEARQHNKDLTLVCINRAYRSPLALLKWTAFYCVIQDGRLGSPSFGIDEKDARKIKSDIDLSLISSPRVSKLGHGSALMKTLNTFLENVSVLSDEPLHKSGSSTLFNYAIPVVDLFNHQRAKEVAADTSLEFATNIDSALSGCHDALQLRTDGMLALSLIARSVDKLSSHIHGASQIHIKTLMDKIDAITKTEDMQSRLGDIWGSW